MEENRSVKQTLVVKNRNTLSLDGVINVVGFDEGYVSLMTSGGRIIVEGKELKIEGLTKDDGVILISGTIDGVFYSADKEKGGIFSRLFK